MSSTTKQRPLTASLHTVTAVSRLAVALSRASRRNGGTRQADDVQHWTACALIILGYEDEASDCTNRADFMLDRKSDALLVAIMAATAKALA